MLSLPFPAAFLVTASASDPRPAPRDDPGAIALELRALPVAPASFGAAAIEGALYIFGGHVGRTHDHSRDNLSSRFLRVAGGTTDELPGGRGLQGLALVAQGGRLIRIGGLEARNAAGEPEDLWSVPEVEAFDVLDLRTGAWSEVQPPSRPRVSPSLVAVGERLLLVGGSSRDGDGGLAPDPRVEVFDPADGRWSLLIAELPFLPEHLHALSWRGHLWMGTTARAADVLEFAVLAPRPRP